MKSSMGILPNNNAKLAVHAGFIRPEDDSLAPGRKSTFTAYLAKQGSTMPTILPQDSPKKTKSLCCPIAGHDIDDEDDDDDYEAYMLRVERQEARKELTKQVIKPESMKMATSRLAHCSSEDIEDYELAKQVIETKTKMIKSTFKGSHSSSELAKQVIEPKTKMNKTSSKCSYSPIEENEDYGLATQKAIKICSHSIIKYSADKNQKKSTKIPKKIKCETVLSNEVTKHLKQLIMGEMNGVNMQLVIQKKLYKSDMERGLNRLNMPFKQLETREFLTEDEKQILEQDKDIVVRLVGPTLQMYKEPMKLKMWPMNQSYNYVLITNWNHFVADHKEVLREGTKIQVWSFRRNQKLCFALAVVG